MFWTSLLLLFLTLDLGMARPLEVQVRNATPEGTFLELQFRSGPSVRLGRVTAHQFQGNLPKDRRKNPFRLVLQPGDRVETTRAGRAFGTRSLSGDVAKAFLFSESFQGLSPHPLETERVGLHEDRWFDLPSGRRLVRVHLPRAYLKEPSKKFPVVYALDGQNLFQARSSFGGVEWNLDEAAQALEAEGTPVIVVGIDNGLGQRLAEYTYVPDQEHGGGNAAAHLKELEDHVFSTLEAELRIDPGRRSLLGSSLGGLFGLWVALSQPGSFSSIGSLSPSVWWNQESILRLELAPGPRPRIWIDMGTEEAEGAPARMARMVGRLAELGFTPDQVRAEIFRGAGHSEAAWASRILDVLRFLTQPQKGAGR